MRFLALPPLVFACAVAACTSSGGSSACARSIADECGGDAGFPCPMTLSAVPTCGGTTLSCGNYAGFAEGTPDQRRITFYYDKSSGALLAILDDDSTNESVTLACGAPFTAPPCTEVATLPPCAPAADGGVPADSGSE